MRYGHYIIEYDRTGFPLIRRKEWGFFISLFPVSKYQFERFMSDAGPRGKLYTDGWYRQVLEVSQRQSWRKAGLTKTPWKMFLTGVSLEEIIPFLRYLGKGFRLPKAEEWKKLLEHSKELKLLKNELISCLKGGEISPAPPVLFWIEKGLYPLVEEGLLEMIEGEEGSSKNGVICLGKAWQGLWPNTLNPEDIKIIDLTLLPQAVGFRVVKEG